MKIFGPFHLKKEYLKYYKTWLITFIVTSILNLLWFRIFASQVYNKSLEAILRIHNLQFTPIFELMILAYAIIVSAMAFFIPKSSNHKPKMGLVLGIFWGLVIFGSYHLFNLSLFKIWDWELLLIDTTWGMVQGGVAGWLIVYLDKRFSKSH